MTLKNFYDFYENSDLIHNFILTEQQCRNISVNRRETDFLYEDIVMAVNRKLNTPQDPVNKKTGSGKSTKPKAPKTQAQKDAAAKAAKERRAARTEADKNFDNDRAAHLRNKNKKAAKTTVKQRLAGRLEKYRARMKDSRASQATVRKLLSMRQATTRKNIAAKQKVSRENLLGRQKARTKYLEAKKPVIKGDKVVTPKVKKPTFKPKKMPKPLPMPRLVGGKIVTTKRKPKATTDAGASKAAKQAAKTKASGKAVEA